MPIPKEKAAYSRDIYGCGLYVIEGAPFIITENLILFFKQAEQQVNKYTHVLGLQRKEADQQEKSYKAMSQPSTTMTQS